MDFVKYFARLLTLILGPFSNGGSPTDVCILLLDFRCSSLGDEGSEVRLESSERNQITVGLMSVNFGLDMDSRTSKKD